MKKITSKEPISFRVNGSLVLNITPEGCLANDADAVFVKTRIPGAVEIQDVDIEEAVNEVLADEPKKEEEAPEEEKKEEAAPEGEPEIPADVSGTDAPANTDEPAADAPANTDGDAPEGDKVEDKEKKGKGKSKNKQK